MITVYTATVAIAWLISSDAAEVQTAAVVLTGLAIIWYTHETYLLRSETQKQTEFQLRPLVLAQLKDDAFAVTNYGNGVAFNISIKPIAVDEDEQIFVHFRGPLAILKSQETQTMEAESFHRGTSAGTFYLESAHKVVKKVKTPSPSQPTRKLGSSCTNLTI